MEASQTYLIEHCDEWTDTAGDLLASAVVSVAALKAQHDAGASLFRVSCEGVTVGYYLLRVDCLPDGAEGVLVAAAGRGNIDLTAVILPRIEAQFRGCRAIRIHTARPGLAKKLERAGWQAQELVMRKEIK